MHSAPPACAKLRERAGWGFCTASQSSLSQWILDHGRRRLGLTAKYRTDPHSTSLPCVFPGTGCRQTSAVVSNQGRGQRALSGEAFCSRRDQAPRIALAGSQVIAQGRGGCFALSTSRAGRGVTPKKVHSGKLRTCQTPTISAPQGKPSTRGGLCPASCKMQGF